MKYERIPLLPQDKDHFNYFHIDDLIYLIENCTKFTVITSTEPEEHAKYTDKDCIDCSIDSSSSTILDEFKYSAILAAEIQKIITRKYLPSTRVIKG